jgi:hypothetical protein
MRCREDRNHQIAQEAVDKALECLAEPLRIEVSMSDWYDPWGEAISWGFALSEVAYYRLDITPDPSYRSAVGGPDDDAWEWTVINDLLDGGHITSGEVGLAIATFSVLLHALELIPDISY